MIGLLLASLALATDPVALRQLGADSPAAVEVGPDVISVAANIGPRVGVTVAPGAWVGAAVGAHRPLAGEDKSWGLDLTLTAGAAALLATPGAALTASAGVRGGLRGRDGTVLLGLGAPLALGLDRSLHLAAPVDLEVVSGVRAGKVWVGGRAYAGAGLSPGAPPSLRSGVALWGRLAVD